MVYKVVFEDRVYKDLKILDKTTAAKILDVLETKLAKDPLNNGVSLKGDLKGFYKYRYGNYRVIFKVSAAEVLIIIITIKHRKDVYENLKRMIG